MSKYITPAIIRASGTGFNLTRVPDSDLAGIIEEAEQKVDAYMGFREDQQGFATGVRANEKNPWSVEHRRTFQQCFPVPIRSISLFQIVVSQQQGSGQYVAATPDITEVLINNDMGYCECIALSIIAYGLTPVLSNLSITEVFTNMTYLAGYQLQSTGRLLTPGDLTYTYFHSLAPFWDLAAQTPVIYVNGTPIASNLYTINPIDGTVTIPLRLHVSDVLTADFTSQIPRKVVQATKGAFKDEFEEYFARKRGSTGYTSVRSGVRSATRRMRLAGIEPEWHALLDDIRGPVIMAS